MSLSLPSSSYLLVWALGSPQVSLWGAGEEICDSHQEDLMYNNDKVSWPKFHSRHNFLYNRSQSALFWPSMRKHKGLFSIALSVLTH